MFAEKCVELIKEGSRETTELILPYAKNLVDEVIKEMRHISRLLVEAVNNEETQITGTTVDLSTATNAADSMETDEETQESISTTQESEQSQIEDSLLIKKTYLKYFLFNKRCLLAYHRNRLEQLKTFRWDTGSLLSQEIKNNLSQHEIEWFLNYSKNLSDYMGRLNQNHGLDLTVNQRPPKSLFIRVRCLKDYGEIDIDHGDTVILNKDSMHLLPLTKCEKLINQGILEHC